MVFGRKILSFFKTRQQEEEISLSFLENGNALLEELIASFNGRHKIPIRSFTAKELIRATNGFKERVMVTRPGDMFSGSIEQRPVLVKKFPDNISVDEMELSWTIRDIVVNSQMSHHKNVLKLIGCCLEFKPPAMVYEYSGIERLFNLNYKKQDDSTEHDERSLSWKSRLRIAKDIANVVVYLHTAFPTPIVHRNIKPGNVIIDQSGVAKLFDFSLCISLPPGESKVEDLVVGTFGYVAPEYNLTGIVTEKIDVYSFGMLMLQLLIGQKLYPRSYEVAMHSSLIDCVKYYDEKDQFKEILDPRISAEGGGPVQEQQLQSFQALAFRCAQDKGDDRPEMLDVAKELRRIERFVHPC